MVAIVWLLFDMKQRVQRFVNLSSPFSISPRLCGCFFCTKHFREISFYSKYTGKLVQKYVASSQISHVCTHLFSLCTFQLARLFNFGVAFSIKKLKSIFTMCVVFFFCSAQSTRDEKKRNTNWMHCLMGLSHKSIVADPSLMLHTVVISILFAIRFHFTYYSHMINGNIA